MNNCTNNKNVIKYPIAKLKPHPRQNKVFRDVSEVEIQALAKSLKRDGQEQPIEILLDGTLVCGHQRTRAAKILGWTEIDAVILDKQRALSDAEVYERLIRDNLDRRQLGELEIARRYRLLKDNATKLPRGQNANQQGDLRDLLGKRFQMSGRNLDRLNRVLDAPFEVQQAVSEKKLSIQLAGKVVGLHQNKQKEIAARIKKGEEAQAAVKGYVAAPAKHHKKFVTQKRAFFECLTQALQEFGAINPKSHKNFARFSPDQHALLRRVEETIKNLLENATVVDPAAAKAHSDALLAQVKKLI